MTRPSASGGVHEVTITALGDQGDGLAELGGERVFVDQALPGDRVVIRLEGRRGDGRAARVLDWRDRTERASPPCRHFGSCGGCRLQHLPPDLYADFKRQAVARALARRGLTAPIGPLVTTPAGSRRRLRLAFQGEAGRIRLGLRPRAGRGVIDLAVCPLAGNPLVALFGPLRALLRRLAGAGRGEIALTHTLDGIDLLLITGDPPDLAAREHLAGFASELDLARICWSDGRLEPEPVLIRRPPRVRFAGLTVELPPAGFLQPSEAAETAIRHEVEHAIGDARTVADLFAGAGTFALPLVAAGRSVLALERSPPAITAMQQAARTAGLAERLSASISDLDRQPLRPPELDRFEAVVLDPPRAGARAQSEALAGSAVPRIAYVSCHPGAFGRDARVLVDAGYRLERVTPIDAFLWSAEIELVAAFIRTSTATRRSSGGARLR
jgi:23S rRNA (uracil1939-C5)-methyltransferase